MILIDWIAKLNRFRKENEILSRIDGRTEYRENSINGDIIEQDVLVNGESVRTSLEAKRKYIEAYAQKERLTREKKVAKADKKGQPLDVYAIKKLRDAEDKKRFESFRHIKNMYVR